MQHRHLQMKIQPISPIATHNLTTSSRETAAACGFHYWESGDVCCPLPVVRGFWDDDSTDDGRLTTDKLWTAKNSSSSWINSKSKLQAGDMPIRARALANS